MKRVSSLFLNVQRTFTSSYNLFNSYKCDYGQGGTLQMNLENRLYEMKVETIWEDYTEVETWKKPEQEELFLLSQNEGFKNSLFQISDGNYKNKTPDLSETNRYQIKVKIPEYYSYKFKLNGNLEHRGSQVDAKTYGNVEVNTILENGEIVLSKIKSEKCSLQTINGKIQILSSLESQNANIATETGDILIKKLGVTAKGHIFSKSGNIEINAIYGAPPQGENLTEQPNFNEIPTEIHKTNFLSINTVNSQVKIGSAHGNLIIQSLHGSMEIKRCDANQIMIENENGGVEINLINLRLSSLINVRKNSELKLSVGPKYKGNIYLMDTNTFWNGENKTPGVPTLFIKGKVSEKAISLNSSPEIISFLKN